MIFVLCQVNHFFLKYELWVPPINPLNTYRLTILFLAGVPGMKEYYEWMDRDSPDDAKLGESWWQMGEGFAITCV